MGLMDDLEESTILVIVLVVLAVLAFVWLRAQLTTAAAGVKDALTPDPSSWWEKWIL